MSLQGRIVGITADRKWEEQAELFRRRGARVMHGPTLATRHLPDDRALHEATTKLIAAPPDVLVATTGIGVRSWLAAAASWGLADDLLAALAPARKVARGPKSVAALSENGLEVHARAATEQMEEVAALVDRELGALAAAGRSCRVAVQRFGVDSPALEAVLAARQADVIHLSVYQWELPADLAPAERLVRAACEGELDVITFTSAPAVENLMTVARGLGLHDQLLDAFARGTVVAGCVGPVCGRAARHAGIAAPVQPDVGRLGLLVRLVDDTLDPTGTGTQTRHDPE